MNAYEFGVQLALRDAGLMQKIGENDASNYTGRRILGGILAPGAGAIWPGLGGMVGGGAVGSLAGVGLGKLLGGGKPGLIAAILGGLGGAYGGGRLLEIPD